MDLGPRWRKGSVFWFSVQVCLGGALLVMAALVVIMFLGFQPHLGGDVEKLVSVVWFSRTSSGCGDLRIVKEINSYSFFVFGADVVF